MSRVRHPLRRAAAVAASALLLAACAPADPPPSPASSAVSDPLGGSGPETRPGHEPAPPSPSTAADWAVAVRRENARPGRQGWYQEVSGAHTLLPAYVDRVSVRPGEDVGLHLSGPDVEARVTALRLGEYVGAGARVVWIGRVRAEHRPAATELRDPVPEVPGATQTHTDVAGWPVSLVIPTQGWPEGAYLLSIVADGASAGGFVPLTVRSADARGRLLLVGSVMTYQAYNDWGGHSLYHGPDGHLSSRARAVGFDRPYAGEMGAGQFLSMDLPIVRAAEAAGLPLAWATDYDLALDPTLLDGAAGVVLGGHSEYWTPAMRSAVVDAIGRGTNVASFGANTAYWRVRLGGARSGGDATDERRDGRPRVIYSAKSAAEDPLAASDPAGATDKFRLAPEPRPESALLGVAYDCNPVHDDWTVADPGWWGFEGTGVAKGTRLKGLVGNEIDRSYAGEARPGPGQVVGYGTVTCRGAQTAYTGLYSSTASGAGLFAAGTLGWPRGMTSDDPVTATTTKAVTQRILREFAVAGAGRRHPAADTVGSFWLPPTRTTPYVG